MQQTLRELRQMAFIAFCFGVIFVAQKFGGKIEGRFWPVSTVADITALDTRGDETLFWGHAEKLRPCTWKRVEWYLINPVPPPPGVKLTLRTIETAKIRGVGPFQLGPWALNIGWEKLLYETYAVVFHECYPFWETETVFWKPLARPIPAHRREHRSHPDPPAPDVAR